MLTVLEILIASLGSQDEQPTNSEICANCQRAHPPNDRVTDEIDLAMIFDPKATNGL